MGFDDEAIKWSSVLPKGSRALRSEGVMMVDLDDAVMLRDWRDAAKVADVRREAKDGMSSWRNAWRRELDGGRVMR